MKASNFPNNKDCNLFCYSPAYWFFDLEPDSCPILPEDHHFGNSTLKSKRCRIYFNLCKSQSYQCSGAVCARYTDTEDFVSLLGRYNSEVHPFRGRNLYTVYIYTVYIYTKYIYTVYIILWTFIVIKKLLL